MFGNNSGLFTLTRVIMTIIMVSLTNCDFGYYGHGHADEEYGLRVCPRWAKQTYCDVKRDLVWRLKRDGFLWGNRCWDNLQGKEDTICGAVLKGSLETCNGNGTLLAPDCERDCRALHSYLGGDCTEGNRPRDRCICYYDRKRPWSNKADKNEKKPSPP